MLAAPRADVKPNTLAYETTPLVKATACADFTFPVYFEQHSDQLSAGALQVISASVARAFR